MEEGGGVSLLAGFSLWTSFTPKYAAITAVTALIIGEKMMYESRVTSYGIFSMYKLTRLSVPRIP